MSARNIIVTSTDRQRLELLLCTAFAGAIEPEACLVATLQAELRRAVIVASDEVPEDVMTMNSTVSIYDMDYDVSDSYTLVYPADADIVGNKLSILTPMGTAIPGCRAGDIVQWQNSGGLRKLQLKEVLYQPEREGALHL
ncbi:MAG: nucleoside diphosphate kinase regulator [Fuerstiella sp.]